MELMIISPAEISTNIISYHGYTYVCVHRQLWVGTDTFRIKLAGFHIDSYIKVCNYACLTIHR